MKKSFILHIDSLSVLDELTNEQAGQLFKAIHNYQIGKDVKLDFGLKMAFLPFKNQFIRDNDKYLSIVERNKKNGSKGGRPPKTEKNPKNLVGYLETEKNPDEPKKADSDSVNDNVNKKENNNLLPPSNLDESDIPITEIDIEEKEAKPLPEKWQVLYELIIRKEKLEESFYANQQKSARNFLEICIKKMANQYEIIKFSIYNYYLYKETSGEIRQGFAKLTNFAESDFLHGANWQQKLKDYKVGNKQKNK